MGSVDCTCPYHNPFHPTCPCVTRAILSRLLYLICMHQHQGSSLLALSPSHQGYAALILHRQLSLSSSMFLLAAPSSTPLLRPTAPHDSAGAGLLTPRTHSCPSPAALQPRQCSAWIWNSKAANPPVAPGSRLGPPASSCLQLN